MKLRLFVPVAAIVAALIAGELTLRWLDGYRLASMRLDARTDLRPESERRAIAKLDRYARATITPGVDAAWFGLTPQAVVRRPIPPDWQRLYEQLPDRATRSDMFKLWNSQFVADQPCGSKLFARFPGFAFVYDPPEPSVFPRYRYIPDTTLPGAFATNSVGWRGSSIDVRKPQGTVRIAFAGASTTVGGSYLRYAYPELVGHWLNVWADARQLGVRFEVMNLGREGISSTDIAEVIRTEAVPFAPDVVVYYEGSNQFQVGDIVSDIQVARRTGLETVDNERRPLQRAARYSDIANRLTFVLARRQPSGEIPKPAYTVSWPADVDEFAPDLASPKLPSNLSTIVRDLTRIQDALARVDATLVVTSFNWNVHDGMKLDPVRHKSIRDYLDIGMYPFRYRDIERLNAFQNRVLARFSEEHRLPFVDLAGKYPRDPDLFDDAIHENDEGVRLHAWIVFQQLVPLIQQRIAAGALPRQPSTLPAVQVEPAHVRTVALGCTAVSDEPGSRVVAELPLNRIEPASNDGRISPGPPTTIETAPIRSRYVARLAIDRTQLPKRASVEVALDVTRGSIQVAILSADRQRFLASDVVYPGSSGRLVNLVIDPAVRDQVGELLFANGLPTDDVSEASIRSIHVMQLGAGVTPGLLGKTMAAGVVVPRS